MKTQAFVVADDPVYTQWLRGAVSTADFVSLPAGDTADVLSRLEFAQAPELLFIEFHADNADARAQMVESVAERFPDLLMCGLGVDHDPALVLAAMRAGARDFFVLNRDESRVSTLVAKLLKRPLGVASAKRGVHENRGVLASLLSAHPGESIAFLAEHLAFACQEQLRQPDRVLLLDVATPAGAAAVYLNLAPTYGVLDAIKDVHRCDTTLVDTTFPRHQSGLYVLSLPENLLGRPEIDSEAFLRLLGVLRGLFACIVLTVDGFAALDLLRGVIQQSDRTLLLSDQSILKSRHNHHLLQALRAEGTSMDRVGLVVDDVRSHIGLAPQNLAELLSLPLLAALSARSPVHFEAMNSGELLHKLAPKDAYLADVSRLAAGLIGGQAVPERAPPGLIGRLFARAS